MNYKDAGLSQTDWDSMLDVFSNYPEIVRVRIFGSRAKGTYREGSDIDLAIEGNALTPEIIQRISFQLNEIKPIPFFVDVVDYSHLEKEELKKHIDEFGVEIYPQRIHRGSQREEG